MNTGNLECAVTGCGDPIETITFGHGLCEDHMSILMEYPGEWVHMTSGRALKFLEGIDSIAEENGDAALNLAEAVRRWIVDGGLEAER